jgi:uncharacterized protein (DUF488 family)
VRIYTIGFAGKSAKAFFALLKDAGVEKLIDIRRSNNTLFAGFTRARDLPFLLERLCGIAYVYEPEFAPSTELLRDYQKRLKHSKKDPDAWPEYTRSFHKEITGRPIAELFRRHAAGQDNVCFLCAEAAADHCHRRLLAEYICQQAGGKLEIEHL